MFNIPEEVKVGGMNYRIEVVPIIRDSASPVGRLSPHDGLIELMDAESDDFVKQTFLHEMVHALHYQMGYNGDPVIEDEQYVDAMANALYALLTDNPGIFALPEEETE